MMKAAAPKVSRDEMIGFARAVYREKKRMYEMKSEMQKGVSHAKSNMVIAEAILNFLQADVSDGK